MRYLSEARARLLELEARLSRVRHPDLEQRAKELSQELVSEAARVDALAGSLKSEAEKLSSPAKFALDNGIKLYEINEAKSNLAKAFKKANEVLSNYHDFLKQAKSFQKPPRPELRDPEPCLSVAEASAPGEQQPSHEDEGTKAADTDLPGFGPSGNEGTGSGNLPGGNLPGFRPDTGELEGTSTTDPLPGHCQRKVARTEFSTDDRELGRPELTPLGECGGAVELEIVS